MSALVLAVALLPVTVFLAVLVLMDSFKLVPRRTLLTALVAGAASALAVAVLHVWLLERLPIEVRTFSRYVAPFTEETVKALVVAWFLWRRQVGFLVDAAIVGFAVGAGFALVENADYFRVMGDAPLVFWAVRGFGTAILHGTATALVAVAAKSFRDRFPRRSLVAWLPGWAGAVALHSLYNHALVSPVLAAALLMVGLPLLAVVVYDRSERATREWVGDGLDLDVELLNLVTSPEFGETRLGGYLRELRHRFPGDVVADMFCLLRVQLELAIRVKGMLMAREAGLEVPVDAALRAQLAEMRFLQKSIGPTGLIALRPLQVVSERDEWYRYLLAHGA
jgi:RsiW-degrading membrane proteinase PrsW (M82 family)